MQQSWEVTEVYKILIVDDERMIREGIKKVIPWETLEIDEVYTASSGFEALDVIHKSHPDLMITDISMSEMTGLELIEKALEEQSQLRVLVLTGYDSFEYACECLRLKVQDFLLKPIDEEVLTDCIRKQVDYLDAQRQKAEEEEAMRRTSGMAQQLELEKHMANLLLDREKEAALDFIEKKCGLNPEMHLIAAILLPELDIGFVQGEKIMQLQQMRNICLSVIDMGNMGLSFSNIESGNIVIVLFADRCGSEAVKVIEDLINIFRDEYGSAPKAAIGNEVTGFENLYTSYQDALYLLQNKDGGVQEVLQMENVVNRTHIFREVYEEFKTEMCGNISDYAYVMRVFDAFCMATESYNLSEFSVRKCCFEIVADIYFSYVMEGCTLKGVNLEQFLDSLTGANAEESRELSRQFLTKMLGNDEKDVHELVGKAKRYINRNLSEDLSVANIAEILFVSPNYFSRLFKRVTGQGCNEYIVRKRMEKACALLETTNFNTGKIAGMVGYNDTNYFSMAFKKHCGVSPTKYRSNFREQQT